MDFPPLSSPADRFGPLTRPGPHKQPAPGFRKALLRLVPDTVARGAIGFRQYIAVMAIGSLTQTDKSGGRPLENYLIFWP